MMVKSQNNNFIWIELAGFLSNGKMLRGEFVRKDDTKTISSRRNQFNNTGIFSSISFYEKPDFTSRFITPIYFDIDCMDNMETARRHTLILCELIADRLGIDYEHLRIFFSGGKGFHVLLPCEIFTPEPSNLTLRLYRQMAVNARKQGVVSVDTSVYTGRRLWRLVNSINEKSGLYKIPLRHKELMHSSMEKITEKARQAGPEDFFLPAKACPSAQEWYLKAIERIAKINAGQNKAADNDKTGFKKGWRIPPCIKKLKRSNLPDGERHSVYLVLARFYSWINMHPEEISEKIHQINNRNPIKDPAGIERIVSWAVQNPGFAGCENEVLTKYCDKQHCFYHKLKKKEKSGENSAPIS
jgi:hypothetical protein